MNATQITLCVDFYINYQRNAKKISPSLAVSYQIIENRRIVLTLIPIELTQTMLGLFTGFTLMLHKNLIACPTPVGQQVFHESVTLSVCFPMILTFLIKHSAEKNLNRPCLQEPDVDHFAELRKSWDRLSAQHKDDRTIKYATS
ncbi:hypothetical protein PRIPAC_78875, partial [Pristionchus pacificus]|uniref:Uncharacterized protein n=1 Tax=Pristionchus pacificus TaxID=54126 RepID=A0A2A6CP18_PRIPA